VGKESNIEPERDKKERAKNNKYRIRQPGKENK
jgi:hypothetical protein